MNGYIYNHNFSTFGRHRVFGRHPNNRTTSGNTNINTTGPTATTASAPITPSSNKWVFNLSYTPSPQHKKPLYPGGQILQLSPSTPKTYIGSIEESCIRLSPGKAEELKAKTSCVLKKHCPNQTLHQPGRVQGYQGTQRWPFQGITYSWKGSSYGYHGYGGLHLQSPPVISRYQHIQAHSKRSHHKLKNWPKNSGTIKPMEDSVTASRKDCISPVLLPPSSMVYPKYINLTSPSGPLSPVGGPITYGVAKELANIICPLVGRSPHCLKNTQHFENNAKY